MTVTTHTVIGAGIGMTMGNPILGFFLGFVSHLLVDMIPHGDHNLAEQYKVYKKKKKIALAYVGLDASIALFALLILFNVIDYQNKVAFSAAIAGSILPDILIGLYEITKTKYLRWFNSLHFFFHDFFVKKHGDVKLSHAIVGQAGLIAILINLIN
jgi:hypothetical protein